MSPGAWPVPVRLALFYAAIFAVLGVRLPFWPLWLAARGLGAAEIGVLVSIHMWVKIAANPLVAGIVDRLGVRRRTMIVLAFGAWLGFALYGLADEFWALLAVAVLVGFLFVPLMPLGENLTVMESNERGFDYGRVRLWGSVAFIAASMLGGRLLAGRPVDLILWLVLAGLGLLFIACVLLPERRTPPPGEARVHLRRVLRSPVFLGFLASASLIQASHAMLYGFGTLHWRAQGLSSGMIGWLWGIGVIAEIALFALSGPIVRRLGPARLLGLAAAAGVVRWTATALTTALPVLMAVQLLHGLTFGAAHLAAMRFLGRAVPVQVSASAQGLYSATAMGAAIGGALMLSGFLYQAAGGAAFHAMAALSLLGGIAALVLWRIWDGETLKL